MIRKALSEVTCKPHGFPGIERPRLRAQELSSPGGSILGTEKGPMWLNQGQSEEKWKMRSWSRGQGFAGTVGILNSILRKMGTRWGLGFEQGKDML